MLSQNLEALKLEIVGKYLFTTDEIIEWLVAPIWILRTLTISAPCLHYPRERTLDVATGKSAKCHRRLRR
jgi:hypothetical protein